MRHGEPAKEFRGRLYGQMDVPLSERGVRQSRATAERLASVGFEAVYSSDLERACFLAELLAESIGLPVRRLEVFRERSMGQIQGIPYEEFRRDFPESLEDYPKERAYHRPAGGESYADLQERIVPAVRELVQTYKTFRVALSCHAGPIRVLLADALQMPLEAIFQFKVDYGSVHVVEFPDRGRPVVGLVNG